MDKRVGKYVETGEKTLLSTSQLSCLHFPTSVHGRNAKVAKVLAFAQNPVNVWYFHLE